MTYIERNKNHWIRNVYLWTTVIIVIAFAVFNYFYPHFIPALVNTIVSPFWRIEYAMNSGSLSEREKLLNENALLKQEIEKNSSNLAVISYIENENEEFRKILEISTSTEYLITPIIKKPPFVAYDELIIDAGASDGISTSSIVYTVGEVPIGRVIDVFKNTSKVLLFSSPMEKHEVQIGKNYVGAIATGRGGGQYEIELPRGLNIAVDDFVVSLDIGNKPLGKVAHIDSDPSLTFEKIIFSAPVNIYQLKWVKISIPNDQK